MLGFYISSFLHKRSELEYFLVSTKAGIETDFPSQSVRSWSKYYLYLLEAMVIIGLIPEFKKRYIEEILFDILCLKYIHQNLVAIISTTPYLQRTFRRATKLGIEVYLIPPTPEENKIREIIENERRRLGMSHYDDSYTYKARVDFYLRSMRYVKNVVAVTQLVTESFNETGKNVIFIPGYLWDGDFPENSTQQFELSDPARPITFGYLGHTVLLKGLHLLLEVFQTEEFAKYNLLIAGSIDPNIQQMIRRRFGNLNNVRYLGKLAKKEKIFEQSDVMLIPSLIDAGPFTLLESLLHGKVVIAANMCGYAHLIRDGVDGYVFDPSRGGDLAVKVRNTILKFSQLSIEARSRTFNIPEVRSLAKKICSYVLREDLQA